MTKTAKNSTAPVAPCPQGFSTAVSSVRAARRFAADATSRYAISGLGVLCDKTGARLAATDGRRLFVYRVNAAPFPSSEFILDRPTLDSAISLAGRSGVVDFAFDANDPAKVSFRSTPPGKRSKTPISFRNASTIDGRFPPVDSVLQSLREDRSRVSIELLDVRVLRAVVDFAIALSPASDYAVRLFSGPIPGEIEATVVAMSDGTPVAGVFEFTAKFSGIVSPNAPTDPVVCLLNPRYLATVLDAYADTVDARLPNPPRLSISLGRHGRPFGATWKTVLGSTAESVVMGIHDPSV